MSLSRQSWLRSLQSTSLFHPPPANASQRQAEVLGHVELFAPFAFENFVDDINELVRGHYPKNEERLLDHVLAAFVLHYPEHGHAILHALLSCVLDGTLEYSKETPPFSCFIGMFRPPSQNDYLHQWALACGETLKILTHYNRPIYPVNDNRDQRGKGIISYGVPSASSGEGTSKENEDILSGHNEERRVPLRLLTLWITDSLLAAPTLTRKDYFRWCGGVVGNYAAAGELRPPSSVGTLEQGGQPQLLPSTPRWAVANGAAVILSVCDDEVLRYGTADLTAVAVPALLLPPESTVSDEVSGLPALEPYAQLFHRYYATATPDTTEKLLLGLLEAPTTWASDAIEAAVQLVILLRAAEDVSSSIQLPQAWLHLHFLQPIGTAMGKLSGVVADAAAALLFRFLSHPVLLFPPPGHAQGVKVVQPEYEIPGYSAVREEIETAAVQANEEVTASALASLMTEHGSSVELRICSLWEVAYDLLPLDSSSVKLPQLIFATPLQPPVLSWNLFRPLIKVIAHLPRSSPSQACLRRIFAATVQDILRRTFPSDDNKEQKSGSLKASHAGGSGADTKRVGIAELRGMVHYLFTGACTSPDIAAYLLADALTLCLSHESQRQKKGDETKGQSGLETDQPGGKERKRTSRSEYIDDRGAVATFDSYLVAATCALACEVQLVSFSKYMNGRQSSSGTPAGEHIGRSACFCEAAEINSSGVPVAIEQSKRMLDLFKVLLAVVPTSDGYNPAVDPSNEVLAAALVATHISVLVGRSRACLQALAGISHCKWDADICAKASAILALVKETLKEVSEVTDATRQADTNNDVSEVSNSSLGGLAAAQSSALLYRGAQMRLPGIASMHSNIGKVLGLPVTCFGPMTSRTNGKSAYSALITEKQDLVVSALPLIWMRMLQTPETTDSAEGSSSRSGWRQIVETLCNFVMASPAKATPAIIFQARKSLRPWTSQGGDPQGQDAWKVNMRVITVLIELFRLKRVPVALQTMAKASDILLSATGGLELEGETCILRQLELLEAAGMAMQQSPSWDFNASSANLMAVLKERIPSIVRCLSQRSLDVRTLSMALIRDLLVSESVALGFPSRGECGSMSETIDNFKRTVEKSLTNEANRRRSSGLSLTLLITAAKTLGYSVPLS